MVGGVNPAAQGALDALFAAYGAPLNVISGYRDPEHNARVGGASNSRHMHGDAFDIDVSGLPYDERLRLASLARQAGFQGFGFYDNSVHFDAASPRAWGPSYGNDSIPDWARGWVASNINGAAPAPLSATASTRGIGPMPMNDQQPNGLLEMLGVQRRDPTATDETALPFYQRGRFSDTMGNLALAFNELRAQPSTALPQIIQGNRARRETEKQRNATAEWIASQGRPDLAEGIRNGSITAAQALQMMQPQQGPGPTSNMRDYEFLLAQGVDPQAALERVFQTGGTTVNVGSEVGTIPQGYELVTDPATGARQLRAIPGGPVDAEQADQALQQQQQALVAQDSIALIDSVLNDPALPTITGMLQGNLPPLTQAGTDLSVKINQIAGQNFLRAFTELRGAGSITVQESEAAERAMARLNRAQSTQAFQAALMELRGILERGARNAAAGITADQGGSAGSQVGDVTVGEPYQ